MKKGVLAALLSLCFALALAGCGGQKEPAGSGSGGEPAAVSIPELSADCAALGEYVGAAENLIAAGDDLKALGLTTQARSMYSMAAADLGCLRYACECALYLTGEGESLDELTAGDQYKDWDSLAALSPSSPYPYYFEGLMYDLQGRTDAAAECYAMASMYGRYPDAGVELSELGGMSADALYSLRDGLRETESGLTERYDPPYIIIERHPLNGTVDYLLTVAQTYIESGDFETALDYCEAAVLADPYDGDAFAGCAVVLMSMEDFERAAYYISEGLLIAPDHAGLNALGSVYGEAES